MFLPYAVKHSPNSHLLITELTYNPSEWVIESIPFLNFKMMCSRSKTEVLFPRKLFSFIAFQYLLIFNVIIFGPLCKKVTILRIMTKMNACLQDLLFLVFHIACLFYEKLNLKLQVYGAPLCRSPGGRQCHIKHLVRLLSLEHTESIISFWCQVWTGTCQTAIM